MLEHEEADEHELSETDTNLPMLATHTIAAIEQSASALCVDEPENDLQQWLNLSEVLTTRAREIRQMVERIAIQWINANGPMRMGDMLYTVGHYKTVHCTDVPRCVDLVLEASGGDMAGLIANLRTDPFKYGSVRSAIGPSLFHQVFREETKPVLRAGVPQKQLVRTNLRFLSSSRSSK